jgi:hypothetical protein
VTLYDDEHLERVREIVRRHHLAALARIAGIDALSQEEQQLVRGLDLEGANSYAAAYAMGRLADEEGAAELTLEELEAQLASLEADYSLHELRAPEIARRLAGQLMRKRSEEVTTDVLDAVLSEDFADRVEQHAETLAAEPLDDLTAVIEQDTNAKKWSNNWRRSNATEIHSARQQGVADLYRTKHGKDSRVFKQVAPDACPYCVQLHTGPDGAPRIFRLSELGHSNVGRRKSEWQAVVGSVHPYCQCELIHIPEGWGFNEEGSIVPAGEFGVEFESTESAEKSLRAELELQKNFATKTRVDFQGLDVAIEQRAGDVRHWKDDEGNRGSTKMLVPYGYVRGTVGADGDGYDVFVGPDPSASLVFVMHQDHKASNEYDEDKAMLGFCNVHQATATYLAHYDAPEFLGSISVITVDEFKSQMKETKRPDHDGMVKGPILVVDDVSLGKATPGSGGTRSSPGTVSMHAATFTSQAGNRAVHEGSSGPNILFRVPAPPKPAADPKPWRDQIEEHIADRAKDAKQQRHSNVERDKRQAITAVVNADAPSPLKPYVHSDEREQAGKDVRADAPKRRAEIEEKTAEREATRRQSPYRLSLDEAKLYIRDPENDEDRERAKPDKAATPQNEVM